MNTNLNEYILEDDEISEDIEENKGKESQGKDEKCHTCKEGKYAIKCEQCGDWGCRVCEDLDEITEKYIIQKKEIRGIRWNCKKCDKKLNRKKGTKKNECICGKKKKNIYISCDYCKDWKCNECQEIKEETLIEEIATATGAENKGLSWACNACLEEWGDTKENEDDKDTDGEENKLEHKVEKEETVSSRTILTATRKNAIIEGKDETEKNGKEKTKENKGELIENGEKNDEETQKEGRGREQVENEGKDDEKTPKEEEKNNTKITELKIKMEIITELMTKMEIKVAEKEEEIENISRENKTLKIDIKLKDVEADIKEKKLEEKELKADIMEKQIEKKDVEIERKNMEIEEQTKEIEKKYTEIEELKEEVVYSQNIIEIQDKAIKTEHKEMKNMKIDFIIKLEDIKQGDNKITESSKKFMELTGLSKEISIDYLRKNNWDLLTAIKEWKCSYSKEKTCGKCFITKIKKQIIKCETCKTQLCRECSHLEKEEMKEEKRKRKTGESTWTCTDCEKKKTLQ